MIRPIRALIVDDEPLARERLRDLVAARADLELIGEAGDGTAALRLTRETRPDIVFLDIQLPEFDGIQLLEALPPSERPAVIFVTAFDRFAVRAFDLHALDYLLKPYDDARFHRAVDHAVERLGNGETDELNARLLNLLRSREEPGESPSKLPDESGPLRRVAVHVGSSWHLISVEDLDWIEAAGVYVRLRVGEKSHLIRTSLSELEGRLDSARFIRIHRSTIVNLDRVREIRSHSHGEFVVVLRDGVRLKVSRTYSDRVRAYLDALT